MVNLDKNITLEYVNILIFMQNLIINDCYFDTFLDLV
jgi:hypothetical protein